MTMNTKKIVTALAILVSVVMILSSLAFFPLSGASQSTPEHIAASGSGSPSVGQTASAVKTVTVAGTASGTHLTASNVMSLLKQSGVPTQYAYLPNYAAAGIKSTGSSGVNAPGYLVAPAPMGLASYGVTYNKTGSAVAYGYSTSSFKAVVNITSLQLENLLNDGPHEVSFQLNAILNGVTIQGVPGYEFWNQNVVFYSARTHELQLLDNVWNFSSPAGTLNAGSILSGNGTQVLPVYYYAVGPSFQTGVNGFTIALYLNSTTVNGNDAVYFNYSIQTGGKTTSGSYDEVIFNSNGGQPPTFSAPPAQYVVNGSMLSDLGFIPMDAEIMIGGPGGGSTATITNITGFMQLYYENGTKYQVPASAYDFGSQTGETSSGVAVSSTTVGTASLTTGPSFLYQLWNATINHVDKLVNASANTWNNTTYYNTPSTPLPSYTYSGAISPSNAFLLVSASNNSFNNYTAQWAPTNSNGHYSFTLQGPSHISGTNLKTPTFQEVKGVYRASAALSGYAPVFNTTLSTSTPGSFTLTSNAAYGMYTPLYAFNNNQVGNISVSNVLYNSAYLSSAINLLTLLPEFGAVNDYTFPAFAGIDLYHASSQTIMYENSTFTVNYVDIWQFYTSFFGLPITNELGVWIENSTGLTLTSNVFGGWQNGPDVTASFPTAGGVVIWNSLGIVVTNNKFTGLNEYSLSIYNPATQNAGDTITGNAFVTGGAYGVGIGLFSQINQVTDNYFTATTPAISPYYNIYSPVGSPSGLSLINHGYGYINYWDLGTPGSGNFWYNFNGQIPYTDNGLITNLNPYALPGVGLGGDNFPENLANFQTVTFHEVGLPSGSTWYVAVGLSGEYGSSGSGSTLTVRLPDGNFSYAAFVLNGKYLAETNTSANTTVLVNGNSVNVWVTFHPAYAISFSETGLPNNVLWSVTITPTGTNATNNGTAQTGYGLTNTSYSLTNSTTYSPLVNETNGTYTYTMTIVQGMPLNAVYENETGAANNMTGTIVIKGTAPGAIDIHFKKKMTLYTAVFKETQLPPGEAWTVTLEHNASVSYTNTSMGLGPAAKFVNLTVPNGTYNYSVSISSTFRYFATTTGNFTIAGSAPSPVSVEFVQMYGVDFNDQQSLMPGQSWTVTIGGTAVSSNFTDAYFLLPVSSKSYSYTITPPAGYHVAAGLGSGTFSVTNSSVMIAFGFVQNPSYKVVFQESGLASGTAWSVTLNGQTVYSTTDTIVFLEMNGTYKYTINNVTSYSAPSSASGTVTVNGAAPSAVSTSYSTTVSTPLNPYLIIAIIAIVLIVIIGVLYLYIGRPRKPRQ